MKPCRYSLTQKEIEESLLCLDFRIEGAMKRFHSISLTFLGTMLLLYYIRYPDRFYLAMAAFFIIVLLLGILYFPMVRRRKKAAKMAADGGIYQLQINHKGVIGGKEGNEIPWNGKQTILFDSENIFTLSIEKEVFCIPKRAVNGEMLATLKTAVKQHGGKVYNVSTKGRVIGHEKGHNGKNSKPISK